MRSLGIATLLLVAACSKAPGHTPAAPPKASSTIEAPEAICVGGSRPEDMLPLPAPDPAFRADARSAYVEFAAQLNVNAFLEGHAEIARSLRFGTREECMNAVRMCGASRDLRAIPLLVRELALPDREHQIAVGHALEQLVNSHEFRRRDPARLEAVHLLPRTEGSTDLRPMCWVVDEMLRSGEPNLQSYAASMAGYLGLDVLAPLLEALLASRHLAVKHAVDDALMQLRLASPR